MVKAARLLVAVLFLAMSPAVRAASPGLAPATQAVTAPASVDELQRLGDTLQDEGARQKLLAQLQALIAAQRHIEAKKPEGMALLGRLSHQIDAFTSELLAGAAIIVDAPRLIHWAREQVLDPAARRRWAEAATAFILVFGAAAAAEWVLRWLIARARPAFPVRRRDTRAIRALFALL